jgi:hypothetical protein
MSWRLGQCSCACVWVLSKGNASCQPSDTQNFDVAVKVLENLQTPCHRTCYLHVQYIGSICKLQYTYL